MADGAEWITWQQDAKLVGCLIPTIDWYKRQGRIHSRKRRQPSLERASVEAFAVWWQEQQRLRAGARSARRPKRPAAETPDRLTWMTAREAADILAVSIGHVGWLARQGKLQDQLQGGRRWVRRESIVALAERRRRETEWVSYIDAARIVGCPHDVIGRAVKAGEIQRRVQSGTARPSLLKSSVEDFARHRAERAQIKMEAAAARDAHKRASAAPDDGNVWLDTATAALVLGLTPGRCPVPRGPGPLSRTLRGRRIWLRRDHVEQVAASRAFRAL